jgi:ASPIC and UnbV
VTSIDVTWPSGTKQKFANVAANQFITIDEMRGILK